MLLDIIIYPDKRLKLISKPVDKFNQELHSLLDNMYETMINKNGVGLAGIQVGIPFRLLIINIPIPENKEGNEDNLIQKKKNTLEIINPIFLEQKGSTISKEGCLSVPSFYEEVDRFKYIKISYQDRYGKEHILENNDFLAIAIQHEVNHLDGKIFIEKLSYLKRKKFEKMWKKRD